MRFGHKREPLGGAHLADSRFNLVAQPASSRWRIHMVYTVPPLYLLTRQLVYRRSFWGPQTVGHVYHGWWVLSPFAFLCEAGAPTPLQAADRLQGPVPRRGPHPVQFYSRGSIPYPASACSDITRRPSLRSSLTLARGGRARCDLSSPCRAARSKVPSTSRRTSCVSQSVASGS